MLSFPKSQYRDLVHPKRLNDIPQIWGNRRFIERGVTMRIEWAIFVAVSLAPSAFGQIGNIPGTGYTGVPYSAVETIVTGLDKRIVLLSRDVEGRTRQEYIVHREDGSEIHSVRIIDPTAGVTLTWMVGSDVSRHVVSTEPLPKRQQRTGPVPDDPDPLPGSKPCGSGCSKEILPPQQINGFRCLGFRIKRIISDPNTKNSSIQTTENWSSPELGVILRHIEVDVLAGRSITEVTSIVRGDPDPSLFQPPQDYTVDQNSPAGHSVH
jgi:hypothetical protein